MFAIFKKELRDCLRWVPIGILIAAVMAWQSLPELISHFNFAESTLTDALGWSGALIAFALGLLQSLFDLRNETRGYLLHRPVKASSIFWAKILAGFVAYVIAMAPAVLLAAYYLGTRGLHYLPVSSLQVIPGVLLALIAFLLHPVAMWIGNRDARWVGTRVLPLAGIGVVIFSVQQMYSSFWYFEDLGRFLASAYAWAISLLAAAVVLFAARHAFCRRQMLPPRSEARAFSWASYVGLAFSAIVFGTTAAVMLVSSLPKADNESPYRERGLQMNSAGEFQQFETKRSIWDWNQIEFSVRPAQSTADFVAVEGEWELPEHSRVTRLDHRKYTWFRQFSLEGDFGSDVVPEGNLKMFSHQGRLLAYGRKNLAAIVTPQEVSRDGRWLQGKFQQLNLVAGLQATIDSGGSNVAVNPFVVDATGVGQLDTDTLKVHRLIPQHVDGVCLLLAEGQIPATLWTVSGDALTRYIVSSVDDQKKLSEEMRSEQHALAMPLIKVDGSKTFKFESLDDKQSITVFRADDGRYGYVRSKYVNFETEYYYGMLEDDGSYSTMGPVVIPLNYLSSNQDLMELAYPPVLATISSIVMFFYTDYLPHGWSWITFFGLAQALIVAVGTFLTCRWFDLPARQRWVWTILAVLGGWGIWLAVFACHRRLVKESCPSCQKPTRVDMDNCTHCQKPWLPPELDQIEIFDDAIQAA